MSATPLVAVEAADGVRVAFTWPADIDPNNHLVAVDRLPQGLGIDYAVTATRQTTFTVAPPSGALIWLYNGAVATSTGTGLPGWPTVAEVVSDAAIELGLVSADIADPFASTDPNVQQLVRLLKSAGRELVKHRLWTHLVKEYTFQTVAGVEAYALPSDFRAMIDDTQWDRTTRFPVMGPTSSENWQFLEAMPVVSTVQFLFRIWQSQLWLKPAPAGADTIAFEYHSTSWVKPAGQSSPTSSTPTAATDVLCFDSRLLVARLKRDWRRNKKQDSDAEEDDFQNALSDAENEDSPARTIYIGGRGSRTPRKLDRWNIPDILR